MINVQKILYTKMAEKMELSDQSLLCLPLTKVF